MRQRASVIAAAAVLMVVTVAMPAAANHGKRGASATLTTDAELHEVVGSDARGLFRIRPTNDGAEFEMIVRGLSGSSWGAHIHGPATSAENAGILVSLCGAPAPAAVETCSTDKHGDLRVRGHITHELLDEWGVTAGELRGYMLDGLTYVNVHTDLNAAGEVRGQIGG